MGASESCHPSLGPPCSLWVCKGKVRLQREAPHLAGGSVGHGIAGISPQLCLVVSLIQHRAALLHFLSLPAVPLAQRN